MFRLFGKPKPSPPPSSPLGASPAPPREPGIKVNPRATYSNGVHKEVRTPVSIIEARHAYVNANYDYEVAKSKESEFKSGTLKHIDKDTGDGDPRSHSYTYTVTIDGTDIIFGDNDSPKKYYFRTDMAQSGGRKSRKTRKNRKNRKSHKNRK
jgi:hypothetical protein